MSEQLSYAGNLDVSILGRAMVKGLEPNTLKSYKSNFNSWKHYAYINCLNVFPVQIIEFKIFLCNKIENGACWSSINSTICALKFFNKVFSVDQEIHFEGSYLAYLRKFSKNPDKRRRPLSKQEFDSIFEFYNDSYKKDFVICRNLSILCITYLGFLRYDDLSQIKLCNVGLQGKVLKLVIPDAKTDFEKKGQSVQFQLNDLFFEIFSYYLAFANFSKEDWQSNRIYLFFHVTKSGARKYCNYLKYDDMRKIIRSLCSSSGVDMTRIGTHSLRIGATTHATRAGVPDRVIDAHGRWVDGSKARKGYQRISWDDLAKISNVFE